MSRVRVTRDVFEVQGLHAHGWETETTEETLREAKEQARCYRSNVSYPVRIKKIRVRLTAEELHIARAEAGLECAYCGAPNGPGCGECETPEDAAKREELFAAGSEESAEERGRWA